MCVTINLCDKISTAHVCNSINLQFCCCCLCAASAKLCLKRKKNFTVPYHWWLSSSIGIDSKMRICHDRIWKQQQMTLWISIYWKRLFTALCDTCLRTILSSLIHLLKYGHIILSTQNVLSSHSHSHLHFVRLCTCSADTTINWNNKRKEMSSRFFLHFILELFLATC